MRKSAFILGAGAFLATVMFVFFSHEPRKSQPQLTPAFRVSPALPTTVRPPENSPGAESTDVSNAQQDIKEWRVDTVVAIPTPREFDQIPETEVYWHHDAWRQLHGELEREPIDPSWSVAAEAAISGAINQSQEITRYGTPTINCRTTLCQVQMVVYGANDIDEGKWSTHFGTVYRKISPDFDIKDMSVAQENGVTAIVLSLSKTEEAMSP